MRALVIGASGQVGAALTAVLRARGHAVAGTHRSVPAAGTRALELADLDAVERAVTGAFAGSHPDWVFLPAGLSWVDYCEGHPDEARRANRDGPAAAARAAARVGAGVTYYSTDYVFDGNAGPYREDDAVNPLSVYGRSKLEGEEAVRATNARALVIRTAVVYGPEPQGKNFVYQLRAAARDGRRLRVASDQRSSPTFNRALAEASVEAAERGLAGVLHVAGPEVLDRAAFARLACDVLGVDARVVEPVATATLGQPAPRPLAGGLVVDRCRELLAAPLPPPRDGLAAMREALG